VDRLEHQPPVFAGDVEDAFGAQDVGPWACSTSFSQAVTLLPFKGRSG
jgi:hypothetical protein